MTWRVSMPSLMILRATLRRMGSCLLGHVDHRHAAFADLLQELVPANNRARPLRQAALREDARVIDQRIENAVGRLMSLQEGDDSRFVGRIIGTYAVQIGTTRAGGRQLHRRLEDLLFVRVLDRHFLSPPTVRNPRRIIPRNGENFLRVHPPPV